MNTLGARLTYLREKKGWTKTYVAKKLGIKTVSTYANWEYDTRQPDNDMIVKIAELYEITTDYLLGRTNEPNSKTFSYIQIFSHKLGNLRRDRKMTATDIANKLNISIDQYKKYEQESELPEPYVLERIANILEVPYSDLVSDELYSDYKKRIKDEKDIAKRLEEFKNDIEHSDGLSFDGEPISEEAKESLIESMEHIFRMTQRINKKYTPKKYRGDEE